MPRDDDGVASMFLEPGEEREGFDLDDFKEHEDDDVVQVRVGDLRVFADVAGAPTISGGLSIEADEYVRKQVVEERLVEARKRRSPPAALDAERAVLSSILQAPEALDDAEEAGLTPADFYRQVHGWIFEATCSLAREGEPHDCLHVVEELARMNRLDQCGGAAAIAALEALLAGPVNAAGYARIIREKAALRAVAAATTRASVRAHSADGYAADIIDEVQREIAGVGAGGSRGTVDLKKAVEKAMSSLPAFGGKSNAIPSGFADVDAVTGGFMPEELFVVAARPSMGKTQWVLDVIKNMVRRSERCMLFSLEQPAHQIVLRMAGSSSGVDPKKEGMSRSEYAKLSEAFAQISESNMIRIDDTAGLTIGQIRARARAEHRRGKLSLIAADYLQIVGGETRGEDYGPKRNEVVAEISMGFKNLARELGIPVVVLSQLNRGVEGRADKRPGLADLRESGSIEQDADVIGFLYREEYYAGPKCPDNLKGLAEFIVGKNRNGPTGTRKIHFHAAPPFFANLEEHQ